MRPSPRAGLFHSPQQPCEGATPITHLLQKSKQAGRDGLLSVLGPEMQMEITDRKVLGKECHKKQGIVMQSLKLDGKMSSPN